MILEFILATLGLISAIGATIVSITRPTTRNKLKLIAILYGITGIAYLSVAYLMFKQTFWYASLGFMILTIITVIAEFVVRNKYNELGVTAS